VGAGALVSHLRLLFNLLNDFGPVSDSPPYFQIRQDSRPLTPLERLVATFPAIT
jgi:hypothetical protein